MSTQINLYRSNGEWCYAAFIDGEFDASDVIGCDDDCDFEGARRNMIENFTGWPGPVRYAKVDDI